MPAYLNRPNVGIQFMDGYESRSCGAARLEALFRPASGRVYEKSTVNTEECVKVPLTRSSVAPLLLY